MNDKIKDKLIEFGKNEENLKKYNPYLTKDAEGNFSEEKFDKVIKEFIDIYDNDGNNNSFSWIDKLNSINKDLEPDMPVKKKSANRSYGLPTHISGDFENGLIYNCLYNPGSNSIPETYLVDNTSLMDYYGMDGSKLMSRVINACTGLKRKSTLNERLKSIKSYVLSEDSVFTKEIFRQRNGDDKGYYTKRYYNKDIFSSKESIYLKKSKEFEEIKVGTNKLVNIELVPFSSINKKAINFKNNKFSMYSAYIILYRIGKHLNNENEKSPIFCFRSYREYKEVIIEAIINICSVDKADAEQIFIDLYNNYFYNFSSESSGSVSKGNLIRYSNPFEKKGDKEYIDPEIFDRLVEYL